MTFVNPSLHKGLLLFARLADMLGSRRPDIPILVVQSGHSGGSLSAIPGIDFSRYPQIMAAPPVPKSGLQEARPTLGLHESTKTRSKPMYFSCFRVFVVAFFRELCELCIRTSHFVAGGHSWHSRQIGGNSARGARAR